MGGREGGGGGERERELAYIHVGIESSFLIFQALICAF